MVEASNKTNGILHVTKCHHPSPYCCRCAAFQVLHSRTCHAVAGKRTTLLIKKGSAYSVNQTAGGNRLNICPIVPKTACYSSKHEIKVQTAVPYRLQNTIPGSATATHARTRDKPHPSQRRHPKILKPVHGKGYGMLLSRTYRGT